MIIIFLFLLRTPLALRLSSTIRNMKQQKNLHGFGMIILDDIAKKYDGKLLSENDKENFTTLISLKID